MSCYTTLLFDYPTSNMTSRYRFDTHWGLQVLWNFLETPQSSTGAWLWSVLMLSIIITSCGAFVLETHPKLCCGRLAVFLCVCSSANLKVDNPYGECILTVRVAFVRIGWHLGSEGLEKKNRLFSKSRTKIEFVRV